MARKKGLDKAGQSLVGKGLTHDEIDIVAKALTQSLDYVDDREAYSTPHRKAVTKALQIIQSLEGEDE